MGLAHTKEVDYGRIEATATASKEFMLQPNMPRFVRVGDKANIAASLINLSDKAVAGTVRMELFNPETEKVFYTQKQKFGVKAGETGNVSLPLTSLISILYWHAAWWLKEIRSVMANSVTSRC